MDSKQRRRTGLLICLAVSAGTGLVWFLENYNLTSVPGMLESQRSIVAANRDARIREVAVKIGQTVVVGEPLLQLVDAPLEDRLVSKRREIAEIEAEVNRTRAAADVELAWRRRELQTEIFETQLKVAGLSQERLNKQVEQIAWKDRLSVLGVSLIPMSGDSDHPFRAISVDLHTPDDRRLQAMLREDAAAASVETLLTQIALCEHRLKTLESFDKELDQHIRASSGVDVAEARLKGARQELAALETQHKELSVLSPAFGTVSEIKYHSGDRVNNGGAVIEILDEQQTYVLAKVPCDRVSKVAAGTKVTLLFPKNERRSGIIANVPSQAATAQGSTEIYLPVRVEPIGRLWPKVAIGSNVGVILPL